MKVLFKNTSTTVDRIRSKNRLVFPNKQAGISIIEVIIAAGILGITLFFSMDLFSTKTQIMSKNTSTQGVRGMEQTALSIIELAGLEAIRNGCFTKGNIERLFTKKFPLKLKNPDSTELSNLPQEVRQRCKSNNFLNMKNDSFYVCKKLSGPKTLEKKLFVIEGRYFYKKEPKIGTFSTCGHLASDYKAGYDNGKLAGGQFYYNLITGPKNTKKRKIAMSTKRRSKFMRADGNICETYLLQTDPNITEKEAARSECFND